MLAGQLSNKLNFAEMQIISNSQCASTYGTIKSYTMCAVGKQSSKQNVCSGDSGGPLVIKEGNSYLQVGVITFVAAVGCELGYPSGYTRVSALNEWIVENLK